MGFGLRPGAKAPDEPPSPPGYAPPLDSTKSIESTLEELKKQDKPDRN